MWRLRATESYREAPTGTSLMGINLYTSYGGVHSFWVLFHGQGVMFWADGAYYSGEWAENQQHGEGKEVYPGGKKLRHKGLWKNGWPVRELSNLSNVADGGQPEAPGTKITGDEQESS